MTYLCHCVYLAKILTHNSIWIETHIQKKSKIKLFALFISGKDNNRPSIK